MTAGEYSRFFLLLAPKNVSPGETSLAATPEKRLYSHATNVKAI